MEKYKPKTDGDNIFGAKKQRVLLNEISLLQTFGCHRSKLRLLTIHHAIWGGNWSTETISYFGLKVIYHQAHLILHANVKNMMVSTQRRI